MLDPASVLDFKCANDFYFMRRTGKGLWHIRHSGAVPGTCYCGKFGLHYANLESLGVVSVRQVNKKCLALYALEEMST
jgi:hypothetical protein